MKSTRFVASATDGAYFPGSGLRARVGSFLMRWIAMPVIVYCFFWLAYATALPDLATRFAGRPFSETHVLRAEYRLSSKLCHHQVVGPLFDDRPRSTHYCAWHGEFAQLPHSGPMKVLGRESWFGRHFEKIDPAGQAP